VGNSTAIQCNSGKSSGQINSYIWQFQGGGSSTQPNPDHDFGSYGNKSVTLSVQGPGGHDSQTKSIAVNLAATASPTTGTTPPADTPTATPPTASPASTSPVVYSGSLEPIAYVLGVVSVLSVVHTATSRRRRPTQP
jgi:PKD repeat protein